MDIYSALNAMNFSSEFSSFYFLTMFVTFFLQDAAKIEVKINNMIFEIH